METYLRGYAEGILFALDTLGRPARDLAQREKAPLQRFTIVYPPTVPWEHQCVQRPHHLMRAFARRGHNVVFVDSTGGKKPFSPEPCLTVAPDLEEVSRGLKDLRDPVVLWVSCPGTMGPSLKLQPDLVVYDIIDEPVGELVSWLRGLPELQERADCCVAVTPALRSYATGKPTILGPNGVWLDHFSPGPPVAPPGWPTGSLGARPVVGYWGALERWVDLELLVQIAQGRPAYDFVVIGPEYGRDEAKRRFAAARNIHWVGPQPHQDLPQWGRCFDVGILPFKRTPLTDTCDPIKVREYLALGLPVVATDLPSLAETPSIQCASDLRTWLSALDTAVEERQRDEALRAKLRGQRRDSVREFDWQRIADRCLEHLDRVWKEKQRG